MATTTAQTIGQENYEKQLCDWIELEKAAIELIHITGALWFNNSVELIIFRNQLVDRSASQILNLHQYANDIVKKPISVIDTLALARAINEMDLAPSRIDIGKLAAEWLAEKIEFKNDTKAFLTSKIGGFVGKDRRKMIPRDVILYGFGRIGRILARLMIGQSGLGRGLNLKAIVVRKSSDGDLEKRASLLRRDSIHGPFSGTISVDEENEAIIANGQFIKVIYASNPTEVDYTDYGISNALVIDNTGKWRDAEGLAQHLKCPGAARVILTAPGKGDMKNVVFGVNQADILDEDTIISAASCTTNAITPTLKVLHDKYTVLNGHVETVHSFTNDQNLIDNYHKADRRGRAATLNMVITETGAAKAVAKALPALQGKLTGNSVRVPTPNVSLAILNLTLDKEVDREEVNEYIRKISISSSLQGQVGYTNSTEVVSSDFIGSRTAGVFDAQATITSGNRLTAYVWYDNEVGYSCQVLRIAEQMGGVSYPKIPAETNA